MSSIVHGGTDAALLGAADTVCTSGTRTGARVATALDRVRTNQIAPAIVIVVVAVAAFLALALIIGAIATYIWYCQNHAGGKWPGLAVPTPKNGFYALTCVKY